MPLTISAAAICVQQLAVRTAAYTYILQQIFAFSLHKTCVIYILKHAVFLLGMQTALTLSTAYL